MALTPYRHPEGPIPMLTFEEMEALDVAIALAQNSARHQPRDKRGAKSAAKYRLVVKALEDLRARLQPVIEF